MKKTIYAFFTVALISLAFVSCTKEDPYENGYDANNGGLDAIEYSMGCQFLPTAEYEAIPLAEAAGLKTLPVSVLIQTPPVRSQGSQGSCTAWGTTYAARSTDWYTYTNSTIFTDATNIFSPKYVYNQVKVGTGCGGGAYVTSALNLLKSQGVCTWRSMPYGGDCTTQPNAAQRAEAAGYKITSYSRISVNTNNLKTFLASNKPVVVAGKVDRNYKYLPNGQVLGAYTGPLLGGHCYCLVGYDDAKQAFKFQNSWGASWSSQGFGWIAYANITSWLQEAYIINTTAGY